MTYHGIIKNGKVILEDNTGLADGTAVKVQALPKSATQKKKTGATRLGQRLMKFAGGAKGLPADMAKNHDHYIHGTPKK